MLNDALRSDRGATTSEELAYRLRQQKLMSEFASFALRTHDVDILLSEATNACAVGLGTAFSKIMEYLPQEDRFIVRAGVGWRDGVVGTARAGADLNSPAGYAFHRREPTIVNNLAADPKFRTPTLLHEHGISGAINVPIDGDVLRYGVLEVDSSAPGRFVEADLAFLIGFAALVGVALERQRAEHALQANELRLRESETSLQQAIAHQQVLTQEISHRVKNSLAMIAGFLNLQSRMSSDATLQRALSDAQTRIHTIAHVHDRLWRSNEVRQVDLKEFMSELCEQFQTTAQPGQTLRCDFPSLEVLTDQAVLIGLLANELVTNAFKYAYPDGHGDVFVSVRPTEKGYFRLEVEDRGVGLPTGFDAARSRSL
jgi:two-component sensor histidine kinase